MRRLVVLMTVLALMMVMLAMSVAPAFARGCAEGSNGYIHSDLKCFFRGD